MIKHFVLSSMFILCSFAKLVADSVCVNPYFQSHMVIQQKEPIVVWGTAEPNTTIDASFDGESQSVRADEDGKWQLTFKSRKASYTPKILKVNDKEFTDILIGEVWVCAGQSNMVWMVGSCDEETKNLPKDPASYDGFRILHFIGGAPLTAKDGYSDEQLARCNTETFFDYKWEQPTFERLMSYSAVSTYFGLELRKQLEVPVGIITTAMGGSPIFSWIPGDVIRKSPVVSRWYGKDWLTNPELASGTKRWAKANFKRVLPDPPVYILGDFPYHHLWEPGFLFDASHKKIGNAKIKGVVWYQGEADSKSSQAMENYKEFFRSLTQSWRANYNNKKLPFITVQLPSFYQQSWPEMRSIQEMLANEDKQAFMVSLIDKGELKNIHYTSKIGVGKRVAYRALDDIYHTSDYSFPVLSYYQVKKGEMEVAFSDVDKNLMFSKSKPAKVELTYVDGKVDSVDVVLKAPNKISFYVNPTNRLKTVRYAYKPYVLDESLILSADRIPVPPFEICPTNSTKKVKYIISK